MIQTKLEHYDSIYTLTIISIDLYNTYDDATCNVLRKNKGQLAWSSGLKLTILKKLTQIANVEK